MVALIVSQACIRSIRFRYTVNGAIAGFFLGATINRFFAGAFPLLAVLSGDGQLSTVLAPLATATVVGGIIGAILGIRRDGTRYLFGRVRRIYKEAKWHLERRFSSAESSPNLRLGNPTTGATDTLVVVYNSMFSMPLNLEKLNLPPGCAITTDQRFRRDATAVVYHVPTLRRPYRLRLDPGQLSVAWFMESGIQYPMLRDEKFMGQFNMMMSYRRESDVWTPYYFPDFDGLITNRPKPKTRENLIAMFFSYLGEKSGRNTYVEELVRHIDVHSYGRFLRNRTLPDDNGAETKLRVISEYKFNLAYENSIEKDYLTEKFFDPLQVGCVPVYMGAPNADDFAPGDHCFINAADFSGPKELAEFLLDLNEDDGAYNAYHAWRKQPCREKYQAYYRIQNIPPFERLCQAIINRKNGINIDKSA